MIGNEKKHSAETFLVLGVFGIFAVLAVLLTLMGAKAYRGIANKMEENNALRSSLSYVANKIRAGDHTGGISLEKRGEMEVLCLSETVEGETYETLLFFADGWLREYAAVAGMAEEITSSDGEKIVELKNFTMEQEESLFHFTAVTQTGVSREMTVSVRSEGGAIS